MSITYDTDTVGSWANMKSYMDEPPSKDYVSGSGAWAIAGEMSTERFRTKPQAYGTFLAGLFEYDQLEDFFKQASPEDKQELILSKGIYELIKMIMRGEVQDA